MDETRKLSISSTKRGIFEDEADEMDVPSSKTGRYEDETGKLAISSSIIGMFEDGTVPIGSNQSYPTNALGKNWTLVGPILFSHIKASRRQLVDGPAHYLMSLWASIDTL